MYESDSTSSLFQLFDLNHLFGSLFSEGGDQGFLPCRVNVTENSDRYLVEAELPGFAKEEIHLRVSDGHLIMTAEHSSENVCHQTANRYSERVCCNYMRSFDLRSVDSGAITARFENGVLYLELPKKPECTLPQREIPIQ